MKTAFIICILLNSLMAGAWTLNLSTRKGFSASEINIVVGSDNCTNANMTADQLKGYVQEAIDSFWNRVPTSSLKITNSGVSTTSLNGDDLTAAAAKASVNSIIIGCNNDEPSFSDTSILGVGGMSCTGNNCRGAILMNDAAGTNLASASHQEVLAALAHEMGHALGLGHTSQKEALMYYDLTGKDQKFLHQDDMDGITYLYPNPKKAAGLAGSCSSINLKNDGSGNSFLISFITGLLFLLFIRMKSIRFSFLMIAPLFFSCSHTNTEIDVSDKKISFENLSSEQQVTIKEDLEWLNAMENKYSPKIMKHFKLKNFSQSLAQIEFIALSSQCPSAQLACSNQSHDHQILITSNYFTEDKISRIGNLILASAAQDKNAPRPSDCTKKPSTELCYDDLYSPRGLQFQFFEYMIEVETNDPNQLSNLKKIKDNIGDHINLF